MTEFCSLELQHESNKMKEISHSINWAVRQSGHRSHHFHHKPNSGWHTGDLSIQIHLGGTSDLLGNELLLQRGKTVFRCYKEAHYIFHYIFLMDDCCDVPLLHRSTIKAGNVTFTYRELHYSPWNTSQEGQTFSQFHAFKIRQLSKDSKPGTRPGISFQTFTHDSWSHLIGPHNHADRRTAEWRGCSDLNHTGKNLGDRSAALKERKENEVWGFRTE